MRRFYIGLDHPSDCWPFMRCMVSVIALRGRKSDFRVNSWIMDSGGFNELSDHGKYRQSVEEYVEQIDRWRHCGQLQAAVSQDYMCEPFILEKTGLSIEDHQALTIERYREISQWVDAVYVMPVIQGFTPESYASHIRQYGSLLEEGQWVGVGSICRRNSNPDAIEDVLLSIKRERPDLRLHGFGLKLTAIKRSTVRQLLHSADSMAWSYAARRQGEDCHDPRLALSYAAEVQMIMKEDHGEPNFVQPQLFDWWTP